MKVRCDIIIGEAGVPLPEEEEFQEIQLEMTDPDPNIRGMAVIELGSFAGDYPNYKDRCVSLLQKALNDPDADVRNSAQKSLGQIEGKQLIDPGKQIIGFGYIPDEYREKRPEVDQKQMILSCVCCIVMIVTIILIFFVL